MEPTGLGPSEPVGELTPGELAELLRHRRERSIGRQSVPSDRRGHR